MQKTLCIQWAKSYLVPANTDFDLAVCGPDAFTWCCESIPYLVPTGFYLAIKTLQVGSKFIIGPSNNPTAGSGVSPRDGYLEIPNCLSLPCAVGVANLDPPFMVPAGEAIDFHLINNAEEEQWMTMFVSGLLIPAINGTTYSQIWAPIGFPSAP